MLFRCSKYEEARERLKNIENIVKDIFITKGEPVLIYLRNYKAFY